MGALCSCCGNRDDDIYEVSYDSLEEKYQYKIPPYFQSFPYSVLLILL